MSAKQLIKDVLLKIMQHSLNSACKEQGLLGIRSKLAEIVPNLSDQYTSFKIEEDYLINKVRSLHSFQISLTQDAISMLDSGKRKKPIIVDIGDSAGTHLQYLQGLAEDYNIDAISVNLDPVAVKKIREKGFYAIETRAELLHEHPDFKGCADILLSYEMVEHLLDPISFLHAMATNSECEYFVVTVPYLYRSRVGLHQVRKQAVERPFTAETTHIFELSPDDWDLIFRFSGWKIAKSIRFTQYPKNNPLTLLRYLWRKFDFDGFYGVILQKDDSISKRYQDW